MQGAPAGGSGRGGLAGANSGDGSMKEEDIDGGNGNGIEDDNNQGGTD
jgi:hypothetical protein